MWAMVRYLGISTDEFWTLTPRHYFELRKQYLDELQHREMCSAFTTAAVVNSSFYRPEQAVSPLEWMPSHPDRVRPAPVKKTPEQAAAMENYMAKVMQLSAELKERTETGKTGPMLSQMSQAGWERSE